MGSLCVALILASVVVDPNASRLDGPVAAATASGDGFFNIGLDPMANAWEKGTGFASLDVTDVTQDPSALNGDVAHPDRSNFSAARTCTALSWCEPGLALWMTWR